MSSIHPKTQTGVRRFTILICGILFLLALASSAAQQPTLRAPAKGQLLQAPRVTRVKKTPPPNLDPKHRPSTPFDRRIGPGLNRMLAKSKLLQSKLHANTRRPLRALARPAAALNFGGFVAAPKFSAFDADNQDTAPLSVFATGDFNKDGLPDLVTVQNSGAVNTLLNQGGRFGSVITTQTADTTYVGGAIQAIAADVDKDGYDDLLLLDGYSNGVDVLIGNHDGTFAPAQVFSVSAYTISSFATADLNGDGYPDLVLLGSTVTFDSDFNPTTLIEMDTYLNDGHGGFLAPIPALTQTLSNPGFYQTLIGRSIVLTDVDGDGVPDATIEFVHYLDTLDPDEEHMILTFHGQHGGKFMAANPANNIVIPAESTFNIGYPLIANLNIVDVNNDGFKDVVFSYQDYNIYVVLGNGDGTYQYYRNVGAFEAYPTDMIVADINGDGIPELIDAEPDHLGIYPNRGDGSFDTSTIPYYGSGMGQWSVLSAADFNGDGVTDVVLMNSVEGTVTLFPGVSASQPSLFAGELVNPERGYVSRVIAQSVLDANGDGNDDILLYNAGAGQDDPFLLTALGNGKAGFIYTDALPGFEPSNFDYIEPAKGDFNGDGHDDLVLHTYDGVDILLSNGDGTFARSHLSLGDGFDCLTGHVAIGDINGDGHLDLIIAYQGDRIYQCNSGSLASGFFIVFGNGDGTFQAPYFNPLGDELYEPVLADLNGDGSLDLVVSDVVFDAINEGYPATFKTFQLLGNGDGSFQDPTIVANNYINAKTLFGDVNSDGKPDLVLLTEGLTDPDLGVIYLDTAGALPLLANGDATYSTAPEFAPGFFSAGGILADLNGDGKLDLVLSEFASYDFTDGYAGGLAALGHGDATFTATNSFEGGDSSSLLLAGDFLKDGSPEALFVSGGSGTTLLLQQGGSSFTAQADNTTIPPDGTVTFTFTVTPSLAGRPQPTGTVTLFDGGNTFGSGPITAGTATFATVGLSTGTHPITATYSGDANFNANTTSPLVVTVQPSPTFTFTALSQTLTLTQGQTGTLALSVGANAAFSGDVTFGVTGAGTGMGVSLNPATLTLVANQSASTILVVSTTQPAIAHRIAQSKPSGLFPVLTATGVINLFGLVFLAAPRRRKLIARTLATAGTAAVLLGILFITSCGGNSSTSTTPPSNPVITAPKGTTTLTVTATPSLAGAPPQTMTVTVTVQ